MSQASVAALIIGVVVAIGWLIRTSIRTIVPASKIRRIIATVFLLALVIFSGWARAAQGTIHQWQGQSFEDQKKWPQAINEYTFAGDVEPTSTNLARTYTSWGLAFKNNHQYNDALKKFTYVIEHFRTPDTDKATQTNGNNSISGLINAEVWVQKAKSLDIETRLILAQQSIQAKNYKEAISAIDSTLGLAYCDNGCKQRAQTTSIDTRIALAQQNVQAKNYKEAINTLDPTLSLPYCDANCKQRAQPLDATSYYQVGNSQLQSKDYTNAISSFKNILNSFPSAKETKNARANVSKALLGLGEQQLQHKDYSSAIDSFNEIVKTYPDPAKTRQVHGDLSKSIMGLGQTTRSKSCTDSIQYYKQLANDYKDTPEGQQAQQELNTPPDVKGKFVNTESTYSFSQIALVQGLRGKLPQGELFNKWDTAPYKTDIQADGSFDFQGIPQGTYDLMWYANNGSVEYVEFIYSTTSLIPEYVANVGPMCTVDMGKVSNVTGYTSY
ncbi:hypothetical protein KDA_64080 [Dictyobacter alpinus]|uniref:Outer membrane lipoprotein BamD-like domain-containing protein n=1 Tax=Dictyobacter alpinus TaxID=2014873 RepID=A0A402BHN5_9CHLR|nr:hypothetical protein KDA_64080 [Dictyobacter alpinus]